VHPQRLEAALRADPEAKEATRELIESRLDSHDKRLEAIRKAFKSLKAEVELLRRQGQSSNIGGH
jgi:hypothetical protein